MKFSKIFWLVVAVFPGSQSSTVKYDLPKLLSQHRLEIQNRQIVADGIGVHLSAAAGDGVAWINGVDFSDGTIEADLKGTDIEQQSFVGIAFHGISPNTLDAVYFRPFNFRSADSVKRIHMVQYVSHPNYTWQVLREKFNGQYEKGLSQPPDPNGWFHIRIEVHSPYIRVFVNGDKSPCLSVKQLSNRRSGKLGLWVGNTADGYFKNLTVTNAGTSSSKD